MSGTIARRIKAPAEWIYSMRVLLARDRDAADEALDNGFGRNTVVEAKLWPAAANGPTAR
jgi:hypothetical protein